MSCRKKFPADLLFVSLFVLTQVWLGTRPSVARQATEPSPTPRLIAELQHEGWVSDAALSPDGRFLATCSFIDQTVRVWDVEKATEIRRMVAGPVWAVAISPDGRLLAASIEGAETLLIYIPKWVVLKKL
jgi:WD40 repeat protein